MLAYLVIREGTKWTDVFRLVPDRTVTIGRAPTNLIVIKDERCSRYHAEIFQTEGTWILRDLDSRNGTVIGDARVYGDHELKPGEIIRIAHAQLAFVHDLSKAFPDSSTLLKSGGNVGEETVAGKALAASDDMELSDEIELFEPTTITHRRGQTRFLRPQDAEEEEDPNIPRVGRAATKLCRLAFELANQPDIIGVANLALEGLLESTQVDAGAVFLLPREHAEEPSGGDLQMIASRSDSEPTYHRVSAFLSTMVLREGGPSRRRASR